MLDAVNLAVGFLAMILSVTSIVVSVIYSAKATSTLDRIREKADTIEQAVQNRLDDLIKRAVPSEQERAISSALPDLLKFLFSNPDLFRIMVQNANKLKGRDAE